MAATIVVIRDEKEWEIISNVLAQLEEGGIIVPPERVDYLDENMPGWEDELDRYVDYDFGGEADIFIDLAYHGTIAASTLDDFLISRQNDKDE